MINKVFALAFALFTLHCQALELTFDRKLLGTRSGRTACGILTCVEHNQTSSGTAISHTDHDVTSGSGPIAEISSLKIFKLKSNTEKRSLLAAISPQRSRLSRVSNGIKVEGHLVTGRASLHLKLNKEADCDADFVCQANGVGVDGKQLVKTSQIVQVPVKERTLENDSDLNSKLTIQVMDLVQEMNAKLAVINNVVVNLEDKLNRFGETSELRMESLKHDLEEKMNNLEDKNGVENRRLEDKLQNVNQNLDAKTDRLEDKLESTKDRLEDSIKSLTNDAKSKEIVESTSCKNGLGEEFGRQFRIGMTNLQEKMSKVQEDMAELGTAFNTSVEDKLMKLAKEMRAEVKQDTIVSQNITKIPPRESCEKIDSLSQVINGGFSSLSTTLHNKFSNLSATIKSSSTATDLCKVGTGHHAVHSNKAYGEHLLYAFTNSPTPKTCYRGMSMYVPPAFNTYTVIDPSLENDLSIPVLCDMRTDGGGWVVIQRRVLGDVDFFRGWVEYKHGFGALYGDFWIGNDIIHNFTSSGEFELRIDMKYEDGSAFAQYERFSIKDEAGKYALNVSGFSGTAGDSLLSVHNGAAFSTLDQDNDAWGHNCAVAYTGAWWYKACHHSNLNGQWAEKANKGVRWSSYSSTNSVSFSEMKIRRLVGKTV